MNTLAAAPNPTGPPILNNFWQAFEIIFTINGRMPQCQRIAEMQDITIM